MKAIRRAEFVLKGVTPLLMHKDDVLAADMLQEWRKDPANKGMSVPGDDRTPPWTWQANTYVDEDGNVTIPTQNLMRCLCKAGSRMILKRTTTFKELTQTGLFIANDCLDFVNGGTKVNMSDFVKNRDEKFTQQMARAEKTGFKLDVRRVGMQSGSKHVRVRPIFRAWQARGVLNVTAPEFDQERLNTLFELAGMQGLCEWRPGGKTPGSFGMFEASVVLD